ncbi:hypothetical protein WJX72_010000 [[Myrmecia] bisecta]|uniref:Uncharacterized protein n=1 Tax=[Myrmecia] bisecta TaxID=41462 RepID=A0AAW1PYL9_9CHLO
MQCPTGNQNKAFTKAEARGQAQTLIDSADKRTTLRNAVLAAAGQPWAVAGWDPAGGAGQVLLGVLASDVRLAMRALRDYTQALSTPWMLPECKVSGAASIAAIPGSVYIKYNSTTGQCYVTKYDGRDRGVLLQLGQQQVGHLPLGLFDEAMAQAPPPLQ